MRALEVRVRVRSMARVIYEAADIICADNECEMSLLFCRTVAIQLVVVSLLKFHLINCLICEHVRTLHHIADLCCLGWHYLLLLILSATRLPSATRIRPIITVVQHDQSHVRVIRHSSPATAANRPRKSCSKCHFPRRPATKSVHASENMAQEPLLH